MVKVEISIRSAINLWSALESLSQNSVKLPSKLAYWLSRNKDKISPIIERFRENDKNNEEYQSYLSSSEKLKMEFAKKDAKGKVLYSNFNAVQTDDIPGYIEAHKNLDEEFKKMREEREDLLDTKEVVEFFPVDLELLPEDIDMGLMNSISIFVVDKSELTKLDD